MLYWRLVDVAYMVGKRNPYMYCKTYGQNLRGSDVLPAGPYYTHGTLKCHVVTFDRVYELLNKDDPAKADAFRRALTEGVGRVTYAIGYDQKFCYTYKKAPLLELNPEGDQDLVAWIQEFVGRVQESRKPWFDAVSLAAMEEETQDMSQDLSQGGESAKLFIRGPDVKVIRNPEWVIQIPGNVEWPKKLFLTKGSDWKELAVSG